MVLKGLMIVVMLTAMALIPPPAFALDADIYGYTKAEDVTGSVRASGNPQTLELTGFASSYYHPMEVYVSRGYDPGGGEMVGILSPGFEGVTTFTLPGRDVTGEDMILFTIPGWTVPVAVGLFRDEGTVFVKAPE